jgi:hypothetical protein
MRSKEASVFSKDINNFWMGQAPLTMSVTYSVRMELDLRFAEAQSRRRKKERNL